MKAIQQKLESMPSSYSSITRSRRQQQQELQQGERITMPITGEEVQEMRNDFLFFQSCLNRLEEKLSAFSTVGDNTNNNAGSNNKKNKNTNNDYEKKKEKEEEKATIIE